MANVNDNLRASYVRESCERLCAPHPGVKIDTVVVLEDGGLGVIVALREGSDLASADLKSLVKEIEKLPDVKGVYVQLAG